jgi:hypothetical protein
MQVVCCPYFNEPVSDGITWFIFRVIRHKISSKINVKILNFIINWMIVELNLLKPSDFLTYHQV